jgi:hypothetical protein
MRIRLFKRPSRHDFARSHCTRLAIMKHRTYILSSRLSADAAIARIGKLLAREGVQYRTEGLSICSLSAPIVLLSLQRIAYSNRNWVGLNPFPFISGVNVRCQPAESGLTDIVVQVNRDRTFLYVASCVCASGFASVGMATLGGAIVLIAVSFAAAWFGLVSFLGGHLIKKEIGDCLKA